MEKNRISLFMMIFTSFILMVGCNVGLASEPTQTPTETVTLTPIPPTATATVTPTATLTPTPTVTFTPTLGVGSSEVNPKDGMLMVYVPEGEFLMGSKDDDPEAKPDEKPQHTVYLDAYWIYQTEVTIAMFQKFIEATGHETYVEKMEKKKVAPVVWKFNPRFLWEGTWIKGANWQYPLGPSSDIKKTEHDPVGQLDWGDADAYCLWAGGRLPTEAEWEKAARGTDGRIYPFGEGIDCNFVNYYSKGKWCVNEFLPVGSYPKGASLYGVLDMAGSVFEWVADWYSCEYYNNSSYENPTGPESGRYHVIRGYYGLMRALPRAARRFVNTGGGYASVSNLNGFRCVVSP